MKFLQNLIPNDVNFNVNLDNYSTAGIGFLVLFGLGISGYYMFTGSNDTRRRRRHRRSHRSLEDLSEHLSAEKNDLAPEESILENKQPKKRKRKRKRKP